MRNYHMRQSVRHRWWGVDEIRISQGDGMKKRRSAGNKHVGFSLNEFLQEEGVLEGTRAIAIKGVVAWQTEQAMLKSDITKVEMAKRLRNTRAALNRLLGPANDAVTLLTL
jgi:antitoxin HicB